MTLRKPWPGIIAIALVATFTSCATSLTSQQDILSSPGDTTVAQSEQETGETTAGESTPSDPDSTSVDIGPQLNCEDPALTQLQMNRCAQEDYETADQVLNQTYQTLKIELSPADQDLLVTAEQAWIAYRDAHCELERSPFEGGSIQPTIYYGCLARMTEARTAELQRQIEQRSQ